MTTYVYTSVNAAYLSKARVLAKSVKNHHPDVKFVLLLAEPAVADYVKQDKCFDEVIGIKHLGIENFQQWVFKHTVVELCTAVKPFCMEQLLARTDCDNVIYLDPDIVVFSPMDTVFDALSKHSIVLTPHLLDAETTESAVTENELNALKHGVYNLGFVAVRNSDTGKRFATWWRKRLYQYCYDDVPMGVFTDQKWIDLVPAFFEDYHILRDRGCNVAPWNTTQRQVSGNATNGLTVNGGKVKFYHFTGLDSGAHVQMLESYGDANRTLFELRDWYTQQCDAMEHPLDKASPWYYDYFSNGDRVTKAHRKFLRDHAYLDNTFADPFDAAGSSFLAWFNSQTNQEQKAAPPIFTRIRHLLTR